MHLKHSRFKIYSLHHIFPHIVKNHDSMPTLYCDILKLEIMKIINLKNLPISEP